MATKKIVPRADLEGGLGTSDDLGKTVDEGGTGMTQAQRLSKLRRTSHPRKHRPSFGAPP